MVTEPKIEQRAAQYYVAIRTIVNMKDIPAVLPPLIPEVINWLKNKNINADGIAFFHYYSINDQDVLDVAVGLLLQSQVTGDDRFIAGAFPPGNYATIIYTGDYKNMKDGHMALESWIKKNNLEERQRTLKNGVEWGGRTEFYPTDPDTEPDPGKWKTEIAFLLEG